MIGAVREWVDRFRGGGDHALSIPSLDGAFRPNDAIEDAPVLLRHAAPDNLISAGGAVHFSSGGVVLRLGPDGATRVDAGDAAVTAMAGAADGRIAVARSGAPLLLIGPDGARRELPALAGKGDVTALAFLEDGALVATIGGEGRAARDWRRDFMERGRSGSVWRLDPGGAAERLADGLAYPFGVAPDRDGALLVSTAWDSALVRLRRGSAPEAVLSNLPGYPARIVPATGGGWWLSLFAPRNQLVEFVLRERVYRTRMMAEIEPEYWVCPGLAPAESPLEVMQDGAQKIGGSIKPWAPSLSYGLIARIGADYLPERSFHSRADGRRHGITSLLERDGALVATTMGGAAIVAIPL